MSFVFEFAGFGSNQQTSQDSWLQINFNLRTYFSSVMYPMPHLSNKIISQASSENRVASTYLRFQGTQDDLCLLANSHMSLMVSKSDIQNPSFHTLLRSGI